VLGERPFSTRMLRKRLSVVGFQRSVMGQEKSAAWVNLASATTRKMQRATLGAKE
jgi:hypothetical protein